MVQRGHLGRTFMKCMAVNNFMKAFADEFFFRSCGLRGVELLFGHSLCSWKLVVHRILNLRYWNGISRLRTSGQRFSTRFRALSSLALSVSPNPKDCNQDRADETNDRDEDSKN